MLNQTFVFGSNATHIISNVTIFIKYFNIEIVISDVSKTLNHKFKNENNILLLVGKTFGHIEQSCFLKENFSISEGYPPEVNLSQSIMFLIVE